MVLKVLICSHANCGAWIPVVGVSRYAHSTSNFNAQLLRNVLRSIHCTKTLLQSRFIDVGNGFVVSIILYVHQCIKFIGNISRLHPYFVSCHHYSVTSLEQLAISRHLFLSLGCPVSSLVRLGQLHIPDHRSHVVKFSSKWAKVLQPRIGELEHIFHIELALYSMGATARLMYALKCRR